jgi:decaprenylphosphoryl-5-phosphoribose phosphatase
VSRTDWPELDRALLRLVRTTGHTPARDRAVRSFSKAGEHGAAWLALGAAGAAIDARRRRSWLRADAVILASYVVNQLVKVAVRRHRPELPGLPRLVHTHSELSFPSAHATTSFTAVRVFAALGVPAAVLLAVATALAASRVWLGAHYPSDVLAGALLGTAFGRLAA